MEIEDYNNTYIVCIVTKDHTHTMCVIESDTHTIYVLSTRYTTHHHICATSSHITQLFKATSLMGLTGVLILD